MRHRRHYASGKEPKDWAEATSFFMDQRQQALKDSQKKPTYLFPLNVPGHE